MCQCRSAPGLCQLIRPLSLLCFLLLPSTVKRAENKRSWEKQPEGGIRRWDWEERKWTGVWNLVEKAGARKRETQSVCHCNGGRFDTQVSAVPVSSGRSFHYQSAPISRPHSILASQEPSCPSALYWALIGWEEHLMLHDWLLLRGRRNVLPVCAYSGTHSNGTVNRGAVSKGALKGRKKRRRNHTEGPVEYQHQGWILHIHTVCFVKYLECNWIFLLPRSS